MQLGRGRGVWARCRAVCLANLGLKVVAVVIAVVLYVLVHRPTVPAPAEAPPAGGRCPP
jgi:hypothetical protein